MPIYEYKGQQYDVATDDVAAAKAKILKYIGEGASEPEAKAEKPAAKPTAAPEPRVNLGSPMGSGFDEITAAATAPETSVAGTPVKAKAKSVFERVPLSAIPAPTVDARKNLEAMRLSESPESVMFTPGRQLEQTEKLIAGRQEQQQLAQQQAAEQEATKQFIQKRQAEIEGYGPTDFAKDVALGLVGKGSVALGQAALGVADIATGWIPDNVLKLGRWDEMLNKLGYDPQVTNSFITGLQSPQMQTQLGNVQNAKGFLGTLKELGLNPLAFMDTVLTSIPSMVGAGAAGGAVARMWASRAAAEAEQLGLKGAAANKFITDKVQKAALITGHAAEGTLTAGSIAEQARESGIDWEDYVAPALAAGTGTALIGYGVGRAGAKLGLGDIEANIAGRAMGRSDIGVGNTKLGLAKYIFGEAAKEGFEELPQGTQEQIFTNIATDRPWNEGVPEASAQSLAAGIAMGGGHAAMSRTLQRIGELATKGQQELTQTPEELARQKGFLVPQTQLQRQQTQQVQQTPPPPADLGALGEARPGEDLQQTVAPKEEIPVTPAPQEAAPTVTTEPQVDEAKVQAITEQLQAEKGYTPANARRIALARVIRGESKPKASITDITGEVPSKLSTWNNLLLQSTLDFQMQKPEALRNEPLIAAIQTEIAKRAQDQGAEDVTRPITEPSRAGVSVAGQPSEVTPTTGAGVAVGDRMVPTGQDATGATEREAGKPTPVEETEEQIAKRNELLSKKNMFMDEEPKEEKPKDRLVTSHNGEPWTYFYPGAEVVQSAYAGAPAKVVGVEERKHKPTLYKLEVDVSNNPEGLDDNGNKVNTKIVTVTDEELNRLNPPEEIPTETPAAVKGKPGPKGARLTPEQKLTSDQRREQQRRDANQASKNVTKAEAILQDASKPLDEAKYEDEAALAEAEKEQRARRGSALRALYQISRENRNKPGQRATELLKTANPKEVADAKAAYEYRKANGILSSRASTALADANFSKAKNGAQALTYIIKNGNAFEKFVAARIRSFVGNVKFVVVEKGDPTPKELQSGRNAEAWARARGVYIQNDETKTRTVYVRGASFGDDQGVNNITVLHELLHAATNQKIALGMLASANGFSTDAKITRFVEELNGLALFAQDVYKYSVANKIPLPIELRSIVEGTKTTDPDTGEVSYEIFSKPQEFLAYGMSDPHFQEYLKRLPGRRESGFSRFVQLILDLFNLGRDKLTAFTDLVDITDQLLSARKTPLMRFVEKGLPSEPFEQRRSAEELAKEWKRAEEVYKKSAASTKFKTRGVAQKAFEKLNPQEAMDWVKSFWPVATKAQREVMARLPSLPFLGTWTEQLGLPHVKEVSELITHMLGAEKVLAENTEQLIYQLKKGFKADPTLQEKLTALVYKTTNAEVDPSDPNASERVARADAMYKALNANGVDGQALYRLAKEHYEDRGDLFLQLLEDNLEHLGLEPDTKKNLLSVLRKSYEADKRIRPYFPFVRDEGQYWLAVGKGEDREFYIYENMQDRDADRARIIKEQKLSKDDTSIGDSLDSLRKEAYETSSLVREVFDAIDRIPVATNETGDVTAKYKETLKDAVYQGYLNVLPEKSFRGMFKHRKGLAGYRTDLIQNIAAIDGKMNRQLARLEYAQRIRNVVNSAQEAIKERPDLQPFVSELRRRTNNVLSPEPHNGWDEAVGAIGRVGFVYMLSGFSLPLIQPLALASSGVSILWGNYKSNPARVGAELVRALGSLPTYGMTTKLPDGSVRYQWPSLVNSNTLVGDELRAVKEFGQSGMHESTLARDIWNYAGKPTSSFVKTPGKELEYYASRTMKGIDTVVGSPFHIMERWTREALFLAAYRLGIADKLSHEEAVAKAIANVKEALGDYDTSAKPRWMQRGVGKAAFALKTFAVLITEQTIGNLIRAMPFLNKEGKVEALKKFSGIMLTMSVLAGASGAPLASVFYSVAASIVMSMGGGDDDDDEEEAELREMDKGLWFRHVWLPRHIPDVEIGGVKLHDWIDRGVLNAITGMDWSSRLQVSTVWGPDIPKPAKTTIDAATNLATDYLGGAYLGLAKQLMNAYDAYSLGDNQKAKELISPKAVRDWLRSERYEEEGVKLGGKEIIEQGDLQPLLLWAQKLGFTPDIVSITQKEGIQATAALQTVDIEREKLLKRLDIAASKDTPEGDAEFERLLEKDVEAFNEKYPNAELKNREINASLDKRDKLRADAIAGITLTKKQANALTPLLERMDERLNIQHEKAEARRKGE